MTPAPFDPRAALDAARAATRSKGLAGANIGAGVYAGTPWSRVVWRGPRVSEK